MGNNIKNENNNHGVVAERVIEKKEQNMLITWYGFFGVFIVEMRKSL